MGVEICIWPFYTSDKIQYLKIKFYLVLVWSMQI